ncbi:MAG TPA: asparaginase [Acidimicrobiia bacterium]|nr:asparaginase [Acidimicrobiia bacterium]
MTAPVPNIAMILAGGTIATTSASRVDLSAYHETGTRLKAADLLGGLPELDAIAAVTAVDFRQRSSTAITVADWLELRALVGSLLVEHDAVVLAHGTNTLEETAYFLDLCVPGDRPVVVVGAMRPPSALSSDAALNLLRAVQVAVSSDARGQGVLVAFNEQVFLARDVVKTSNQRVDAFGAPDAGPVGFVDSTGHVRIDRRRTQRGPSFDVASLGDLPRVDLVVSHVGADEVLVDAAVAAGARGIVSVGTGAGRATPLEDHALARAAQAGVVVCRSSRVAAGTVVPTPGTAGLVAGRGLAPWKARVLLSLALTVTADPAEIQLLFDQA